MTADLVVLDTNIWTHLYSASKQHVDAPLWRRAMVGLEVVIAQQTRAEVLYALKLSTWSATRKTGYGLSLMQHRPSRSMRKSSRHGCNYASLASCVGRRC